MHLRAVVRRARGYGGLTGHGKGVRAAGDGAGRSLLSVGQLKKAIDNGHAGDELLYSSTGRLRHSAQLTALRQGVRETTVMATESVANVLPGGEEALHCDAAAQQLVSLMRSRNALSRASSSGRADGQ